jgi:hypothetical protein
MGTFEPKRVKVTQVWRELHNEELLVLVVNLHQHVHAASGSITCTKCLLTSEEACLTGRPNEMEW